MTPATTYPADERFERELAFLLVHHCGMADVLARPTYTDHNQETIDATLSLAHKLAASHFAGHYRNADANEPQFVDGRVQLPADIKTALDEYARAGFFAVSAPLAEGGMQLPQLVQQALNAIFFRANAPTAAYAMLTHGNANLIAHHGTPAQKARYVPHLRSGRFFGTMCLSEPHAGSSLADIRTTAYPEADGSYRIVGNKMWISGGEHELSENIIHLVLARLGGAPAGVKGISLFIVPKIRVEEDGTLGPRNDVTLAGLNHKMGYRGTTNCALNFGEQGGAWGELVGRPGEGLANMFLMMKEARIAVGLGATMFGYRGYQYALAYAMERTQGRRLGERDPASPPVAIIEHGDVRRMLLAQKVYAEGALALCLAAARWVDDAHTAPTEAERTAASRLLDLLTPIVKAWPSEWCLKANDLAIQVHGGAGYTRDYAVEQLYRDNRLNPIHEGTNGIQALDLLGRKVSQHGGAGFSEFALRVAATIAEVRKHADTGDGQQLCALADALAAALELLRQATARVAPMLSSPKAARILANAGDYLNAVGHVAVGWQLLAVASAAARALDSGSDRGTRDFAQGKLAACAYFAEQELPLVPVWLARLEAGGDAVSEMRVGWF